MRFGWIWFLVVAVLIGIVVLAARMVPGGLGGAIDDDDRRMRVVYLLLILTMLSAGLAARLQSRPGSVLSQLGVWVLIFAGLIMVYSFRGEFSGLKNRFMAELQPAQGQRVGPKSVSFAPDENGHYRVFATANGAMLEFVIDTGATDVVLSPHDARQIGLDPGQLAFTNMVQTANGDALSAPIMLNSLAVGPIVMNDIPASVNQADMSVSLLGMEFLRRLSSWRVENGRLTLEQ